MSFIFCPLDGVKARENLKVVHVVRTCLSTWFKTCLWSLWSHSKL